jgi:hypothetical protein
MNVIGVIAAPIFLFLLIVLIGCWNPTGNQRTVKMKFILLMLSFTAIGVLGAVTLHSATITVTPASEASFNAGAVPNPGDTVMLTGVLPIALLVRSSGTAALPIAYEAEPGCDFSSPAWGPNGAIYGVNVSNVIVDGMGVGVIENTANGTSLANQINSKGIYFIQSSGIVVRGWTIRNLYQRTGQSDTNRYGWGIIFAHNGGAPGWGADSVSGNIIHDMFNGVQLDYGPGTHDISFGGSATVPGNTIYDTNWGIIAGDHSSAASLTNFSANCNFISNFTDWDSASDFGHHACIFAWSVQGGASYIQNVTLNGNICGPNFSASTTTSNATAALFIQGEVRSAIVTNNTCIEANSGDYTDDGLICIYPNSDVTGTFTLTGNYASGFGNGAFIGLFTRTPSTVTGSPTAPGIQTFVLSRNFSSGMKTAYQIFDTATMKLSIDHNLNIGLNASQQYCLSANSTGHFLSLAGWQALGYDKDPLTPP